MNWLQKMFVKAAASVQFAPKWTRYSFLPVSWRRLADGYRKNSAVAACATTLAFSFSEPPLLAGTEQDGRFVADYGHPILKLLRNPNPDMGDVELLQFAVSYAAIGGNLYLWKQRRVNGQVMALWPFSDLQISPLPGRSTEEGIVRGYELDPGDGQKVEIPKDDIIQWKWMPDPDQPWRGIGAIEFCIREVDRDAEATSYIYSLLKNNGVPSVVVTLAEGDDYDETKADRLRQQWIQKIKAGPAFIEFGMKAEKMGMDLQQLAAETLNAVPESRIAAAFRVPPVVAGLSVGLKRSDYGDQAARRSFTELTLTALWRSLASEIRNGLKDDFGLADNFQLQFDLRQVRALQEEETKIWERVTLAFDRSVITRSMAKEMLGIRAAAGDEVYKVSLATEFLPAEGSGVVERDGGQGTEDGGPKTEDGGRERKGRSAGQQLQRIRLDVARRMSQAVDVYFSQLADRVIERADPTPQPPPQTGEHHLERGGKKLPNAGELLNADDRKKLEGIVKRFFVEIIELSWQQWNLMLGIDKAFDLTDPIVAEMVRLAGKRVKEIHDTTLQEIRDVLRYANEHGWSIDDLVRGDDTQRGLRSIVDELYKDRARTIARTELGEAQNAATVARYREAGVKAVEILDNGSTDDDEECRVANGQIWSLNYFDNNRLEHPNCTRAAAPVFDDVQVDRG